MTDIRQELNLRRNELREREPEDRLMLARESPRSQEYERAVRNIGELRSIEATLATMQLADAQRENARAQRAVAEAQADANRAEADARELNNDRSFWARRFMTTATVANAAGLVSVLSYAARPEAMAVGKEQVAAVLAYFFAGTFLGGLYPLFRLLGIQLKLTNGRLPSLAEWALQLIIAAAFLRGLILVVEGLGIGPLVSPN